MRETFRRLLSPKLRREEGASAVEYGLLVAGIAAVIVAVVFALGTVIKGSFSKTNDCIAGSGSGCAAPASVTP